MSSPPHTPAVVAEKRPRRRTVLFGTRLAAGALLCGATIVGANVLVAPLARWAIADALPHRGVTVELASARLSWGRVRLAGLRVTLPDPSQSVTIDSVAAEFSVPALLASPHRVRKVRLSGVDLTAVRRDQAWAWLEPLTAGRAPTTAVAIEQLELDAASVRALGEVGAELAVVDKIRLRADDVVLDGAPQVRARELALRVGAPDWVAGFVRVSGRAALASGTITVGTLQVTDAFGGRVDVSGAINVNGAATPTTLTFTGTGLDLAQLSPALRGVAHDSLRASVRGSIERGATGYVLDAATTLFLVASGDTASAGRVDMRGTLAGLDSDSLLKLQLVLTDVAPAAILADGGPPLNVSGTLDTQFLAGQPTANGVTVAFRLASPLSGAQATPEGGSSVGTGTISVDDQVLSLVGQAVVEDDGVDASMELALAGVVVKLTGILADSASAFTWDLAATVRGTPNLPVSFGDMFPSLAEPLSGSGRVRGHGSSLTTAVSEMTLHAQTPSAATRASVHATLGDGTIRLGAGLTGVDGSVILNARAPVAELATAWTVDEFTFDDITAFRAVRDSGRVFGRGDASATASGLRADVRIDSIRHGLMAGATATLVARGQTRDLRVRGAIERADTRVEIAQLVLDESGLREADFRFRDVDLATFDERATRGQLSGQGTLRLAGDSLRGRCPAVPTRVYRSAASTSSARPLCLQVAIDRSVQGNVALTGGFTAGYEAEQFAFALALMQSPSPTAQFALPLGAPVTLYTAGRGTIGDTLAVQMDSMEFLAFEPSTWLQAAPVGAVSGSAHGSFRRAPGVPLESSLVIALDSSTLGPIALRAAQIRASNALGELQGRLQGNTPYGPLTATVRGGERPDGAWGAKATLRLLTQADSATREAHLRDPAGDSIDTSRSDGPVARALASVPFDLTVDLQRDAPQSQRTTPDWTVQIDGGGALQALRLDTLVVRAVQRDGRPACETVLLRGPSLDIRGWEALRTASGEERESAGPAFPSAVRLAGTIQDPGPIAELLGAKSARGVVSVMLTETASAPGYDHLLQVTMRQPRLPAFQADSLGLQLHLQLQTDSSWLGAAAAVAYAEREQGLSLDLGGTAALVPGVARAPRRMSLSARWERIAPKRLTLGALNTTVDDRDWSLDHPAVLDWSDGLSLDSLRLRSTAGLIALAGSVDRDGTVTWADIELATIPVTFSVGSGEPLRRRIDISSRYREREATAPPAPTDGLRLVATLTAPDSSASRELVELHWADEVLNFDLMAMQPRGGLVELRGRIPIIAIRSTADSVRQAEASVVVQLDAREFDLTAVLRSISDAPGRVSTGMFSGTAQLTGTVQAPSLSGQLAADDVLFEAPGTGTTLRAERFAVVVDQRSVRIEQGRLRSARSGYVDLSGGIDLTDLREPTLDIRAQFNRFEAMRTKEIEAVVGGALVAGGSLLAPQVSGNLELIRGAYFVSTDEVPSSLERVDLTDEDLLELEQRLGYRIDPEATSLVDVLFNRLALDVGVDFDSGVWARRTFEPAMAVELSGALRATKGSGAPLRLDGQVQMIEGGAVSQFGRSFSIVHGTVQFAGVPEEATVVARAKYDVSDVSVILDVAGDANALALTLGSEPALSESDIISYLAVGHAAAQDAAFGAGASDAYALGVDLALNRVTSNVQELARAQLGLDVVEIQQDGLTGLNIVAGRNVNRRLFVGFQQPVVFSSSAEVSNGIDQTELQARYRVNRWLLANVTGGRALFRLFLVGRRAF